MAFASLPRQTWTLTKKNLRIAFVRHWFATFVRAFLLPLIFIAFISFARNLFIPPATFGIGSPAAVRDLASTLAAAHPKKLVFVTNSLGSVVDNLVNGIAEPLRKAGGIVVVLKDDQAELQIECKQALRGTSDCFAAAVFNSVGSGGSGNWNYTLRGDSALGGGKINVKHHNNDVQKFLLPLQLEIDKAIANSQKAGSGNVIFEEYMYTSKNKKEREDDIRTSYMGSITDYIAVSFFLGLVGIIYQLVGFQSTERERGLSTLIQAMGGSQASRLLSYHLSFDIIYAPGWVVMALILSGGVFAKTNIGVILIWYILTGMSLASWSVFGASFFKKAQLSGIVTTILSLVLGIVAQILTKGSTGIVAILSLLFPPMNYVFFAIYIARFERQGKGASIMDSAPKNASTLPGIVFWIFLIVQIIVFPILAAMVERWLYGTSSKGHRTFNAKEMAEGHAVELRGFTKKYVPGFQLFGGKRETVVAVNNLNLDIRQGEVMVLLGANGSGKTTTLEAITGLGFVKEGEIRIATGTAGLGVCPQKNVLWDDLTVEEHVRIWNKLKCRGDDKETLRKLIEECDLGKKRNALSKTLSGGQKRKLQLAAMFTGGSKVCAVDEVSSGLDPLSRRKIWDIILAARGERTIILTTHFLDEADLLADHIAILSKGVLKSQGSAVELKARLGGGYRVHTTRDGPELDGIPTKRLYDQTIYNIPDSAAASRLVDELERRGVEEYHVSGPTIEDVFLKVAEESAVTRSQRTVPASNEKLADEDKAGVKLYDGKRLSVPKQAMVMFGKRLTILKRNYLPTCAAILIPILAAGLTMIFLSDYQRATCSQADQVTASKVESFYKPVFKLAIGPQSKLSPDKLARVGSVLVPSGGAAAAQVVQTSSNFVDSLGGFENYISANYRNVTPGGFFLGDDKTTYGYKGDGGIRNALIVQNLASNAVFDLPGRITTQYAEFDLQGGSGMGKSLQFVVYIGLAMSAFPAFFALYPTIERLRMVRALHYSNGVRALPLWLAYVSFDFVAVLFISVVVTIIFAASIDVWYNIGYVFVILMLYGLASINLAYIVSLVAKSQLAAFAFAAGTQAAMFLIYFIAYISVLTYTAAADTDKMLNIVHFSIAAVTPVGNLIRGLFVALNIFSITCRGKEYATNPGQMKLYGGPILYLFLQSAVLFGILIWWDSGALRIRFKGKFKPSDDEKKGFEEKEMAEEIRRVDSSSDGLRVSHLSKVFKKFVAVEDVSFGVARSEVFALLGPNGAGKTTTINMIRGDMAPDAGDIFVENVSVVKHRAEARGHLGVCPQFDAMDRMTVIEHLRFYAKIRGVENVEHNVQEVITAVGLDTYSDRMAEKLSGGNKRKLSLGIALMGNPTVLLLDEPSSGMDAASKRVMWKTLAAVTPGRSLVLTTHSMEEADALASRAGILSQKMLALGTSDHLRRKYGDAYHIHLVLKSAPNSTDDEMNSVKNWVRGNFDGAVVEEKSYHGQIKFSVPASRTSPTNSITNGAGRRRRGVNAVFKTLEEEKEVLGLEYYSVSQTTLDQVFLTIVGNANVAEEGYAEKKKSRFLCF